MGAASFHIQGDWSLFFGSLAAAVDVDGLGYSSGTGSRPPSHMGWQRTKRLKPKYRPLNTPNRRTASIMYSEQEG